MSSVLCGTRVMLRSSGLSIKYWPHAARTFAANTNKRRKSWPLKRNTVPLRVFGHRGVALLPRNVRDQQDVSNKVTERVMFLSYVPETAGGVYVLTQDGKVLVSFVMGVAMQISRPDAFLVKLDLLCRHLAIDHRAKFAIADRQGFFPLKRGLPLA